MRFTGEPSATFTYSGVASAPASADRRVRRRGIRLRASSVVARRRGRARVASEGAAEVGFPVLGRGRERAKIDHDARLLRGRQIAPLVEELPVLVGNDGAVVRAAVRDDPVDDDVDELLIAEPGRLLGRVLDALEDSGGGCRAVAVRARGSGAAVGGLERARIAWRRDREAARRRALGHASVAAHHHGKGIDEALPIVVAGVAGHPVGFRVRGDVQDGRTAQIPGLRVDRDGARLEDRDRLTPRLRVGLKADRGRIRRRPRDRRPADARADHRRDQKGLGVRAGDERRIHRAEDDLKRVGCGAGSGGTVGRWGPT